MHIAKAFSSTIIHSQARALQMRAHILTPFRKLCGCNRIESVGSNPIPGTLLTSTVSKSFDGSFEDYLREVKRNAPDTIHSKLQITKRLKKRVNIWDSEEVTKYIINSEMTNGHKNCIGFAYQDWCRWNGFDYEPIKFKRDNKLPYIPSEVDLDQLIAGNGNKIGCFLQFLKESACRPIEAWRLTPEDFDLNQQVCYINKPAHCFFLTAFSYQAQQPLVINSSPSSPIPKTIISKRG